MFISFNIIQKQPVMLYLILSEPSKTSVHNWTMKIVFEVFITLCSGQKTTREWHLSFLAFALRKGHFVKKIHVTDKRPADSAPIPTPQVLLILSAIASCLLPNCI